MSFQKYEILREFFRQTLRPSNRHRLLSLGNRVARLHGEELLKSNEKVNELTRAAKARAKDRKDASSVV